MLCSISTQCAQIQIGTQIKWPCYQILLTFALRSFFPNIVIIAENTKYCLSRDDTYVQNRRQRETLTSTEAC